MIIIQHRVIQKHNLQRYDSFNTDNKLPSILLHLFCFFVRILLIIYKKENIPQGTCHGNKAIKTIFLQVEINMIVMKEQGML